MKTRVVIMEKVIASNELEILRQLSRLTAVKEALRNLAVKACVGGQGINTFPCVRTRNLLVF